MRMIWWLVVAITLAGNLMDETPRQAPPADNVGIVGIVTAKDGSGEPPRPPKP